MAEVMLSLSTNPYDPFTEYELWLDFDRREGFNTQSLMARVVPETGDLPEPMAEVVIEQAIDEFVNNPSFRDLYKKVTKSG